MSAVLQMLNSNSADDSESSSSECSDGVVEAGGFPTAVVATDTTTAAAPAGNVITLPVSEVTLTPDQLSQIEAALTSEEGQKILETFADPAFIPQEILEPGGAICIPAQQEQQSDGGICIPAAAAQESTTTAICIPAQELDSISLQHTVAISTAASADPKLQSPPIRTATPIDDSNQEEEPGYYGFLDHSYCSTALDRLEHEGEENSKDSISSNNNAQVIISNCSVVYIHCEWIGRFLAVLRWSVRTLYRLRAIKWRRCSDSFESVWKDRRFGQVD